METMEFNRREESRKSSRIGPAGSVLQVQYLTSEVVQWMKALVAKPDDHSSTPRTHILKEENLLL